MGASERERESEEWDRERERGGVREIETRESKEKTVNER